MKYAISSESMKLSDEKTIKSGVSAIELMDRASHALFCVAREIGANNIAVVCGSGNNGGDGYALSLKLLDSGRQVQVYGKIPKTQSAMYYYDILMDKYSERFCPIEKMQSLESFDLVVDCLLGIGIIGQLSAEYASYIDKINTGKYIVSCDIPSGLNSDNGKKSPVSVIANRTIAVQSYKTGHFLADGKDVCGNLEICDIGIEIFGKKYFIVDSKFVKNCFSIKLNNSHKGDYGRCGIVACSENFVGAGKLAFASSTSILGESAMRVGCGYCYLFVPQKMLPYMWGEVTHSCIFSHKDLDNHKLDSIVFGMGIGDNPKLCEKVFRVQCEKIIDADAISYLAKNKDSLKKLKGCVLTPHPMEFSRLIGLSVQEILSNPIEIAEQFAKDNNLIVVLKSATSIITNGEQTYLNTSGCSGQAKGGSGDVLSGIIGSLLAQKIPAFEAAVAGCYIAGKTAEIVADKSSVYSMLPVDIATSVGNTLSSILKDKIWVYYVNKLKIEWFLQINYEIMHFLE